LFTLFLSGAALLGFGSPAAAESPCERFDARHTITALGGPNALAPGGVETRADLQAQLADNEEAIRTVLASQGLRDDVVHALLAAVRDGVGISERVMPEGEELEWMAYRKGGEVRTIEDVCLRLREAAPAFEIAVPIVTATTGSEPECGLEVTRECQAGAPSVLRVRTPSGADVTVAGPGGVSTQLKGGETTWTAPSDARAPTEYTFTVVNEAATRESVTTYRFLVPRECMNLAFIGRTETQRIGDPVTCTKTVTAEGCPPPPPPPPRCAIDLSDTRVRRGKLVTYEVTGEWTGFDVGLEYEGEPLADPKLVAESGSFIVRRRGSYTVVAAVRNELGATETCRASIDVFGINWAVRPFAAALLMSGSELAGALGPTGTSLRYKACPCAVGTAYGYDDGYGFGLSAERRLSERLGVELRGVYSQLDDDLWIGANGVAVEESDSRSFWDLSIGLNVHLTPNASLDWYAGPFVGYSDVEGGDSLAVDRSLQYEVDGGVSWGAQTGLDWPFGSSRWSLHFGARYAWTDQDVTRRFTRSDGAVDEHSETLDLDPVTLELGVAYRF
jgi:outer membrane protein W